MKKDYPDIQALENEKWQDPDPATGKLGTRVPAKWLQLVEDSSKSLTLEILEVLKEAKIEPNELKNTQLKDAVIAIAAARIINWKDVQNAPKILDVLGDSKIDGASQRIVNTVNKLAKDAMTAANLANDKANEAKQGAYEADQKATAAKKKADQVPEPIKDNFIVGNDEKGYKLMTAAQVKTLLAIPAATNVVNEPGDSTTDAISQKTFTNMSFGIGQSYKNLAANRVAGVTYTNEEVYSIDISVTRSISGSSYSNQLYIDNILVSASTQGGSSGSRAGSVNGTVHPGSKYRFEGTFDVWSEARKG